ncbi:hypothetical protein DFH06DRAFT_471185 [Mycena polygramma]|nr:hypothetical protein DFH06DRAFT_471185 [Mycena polygramma]
MLPAVRHITAANVNHVHRNGDSGIHILHRSVGAHEAIYDSAESFPQPRCHPETRLRMLASLWRWATNTHPTVPVLWLYGPAGAGKSAVMQTLCQQLENAGCLGASFYFKRGHPTRGNGAALFATLAYQLAIHNRPLKHLISEAVERSPGLARTSMASQLLRPADPPQVLRLRYFSSTDSTSAMEPQLNRRYCVQYVTSSVHNPSHLE